MSLGAEAGPGAFSAVFQSQAPGGDIDVERSMYFGPNFEVSTAERGSHVLSTLWVFAEGSRGGELFDNFFLFFNPHPWTATVSAHFYRPDGGGACAATVHHSVGAPGDDLRQRDPGAGRPGLQHHRQVGWRHSRRTLDVLATGGHATGHAVGRRTHRPRCDGTSKRWFFAEGVSAPGFETFYMVFNPTAATLVFEANFFTEAQGLVQRVYAVPPGGRQTIYANAVLGNIGGMAAYFSGTIPFIAERSIYWGQGRVEGTNTIGETSVARRWDLPEGAAGAASTRSCCSPTRSTAPPRSTSA